ncbi:MAG TPA: zinc ribbon domain-containing protein [Candidatus Aquilonibacter sp.]|nr:zinc ribbon domain-containing protein [Candidatus Aquilonibacter sp.]
MNGKEPGTSGGITSAWNERMRLIRLRRKKERSRFRDELKVIPRWLVITLAAKFVIVQIVAMAINLSGVANNGVVWPVSNNAWLSSLALAGIVTLFALFIFPWILLLGYVNRDAKRRGMNSALWTLVCIILMPAYVALGFIIYFLVREPLPYACPKCGATVGPRFNFCPTCRCDLHPSCPNCRREIVENDKFCPFCGQDLAATVNTGAFTT